MTHPRWREAFLIVSCSLALRAGEQHLKYDDGMEVYELRFDDQKISVSQIQKLVWLSPYLPSTTAGAPFMQTSSWVSPGPRPVEVDAVVPWLEVCNTGYTECSHPTLNASFLRNARVNLRKGKEEIEALHRTTVPPALEPVKEHFLHDLEFSSLLQQLRYTYFKSGNVRPLRNLLCEQCQCGRSEEGVINNLKNASSGAAKPDGTNDWQNEVLSCRTSKASKYPFKAWKRFVSQFGIQEKYYFRHVE